MMLAAELTLAGVDVALLERRTDHVLVGSRAGGFHSRTIEVLDQRGVAGRFLAEGQVVQAATFGTTVLDMSDFPTRHPYSVGIWQNQIEQIMAEWIAELPVHIRYGCEVTGFAQDDTGVDVRLSGGESLRSRYLVGRDGGRSLIRKAAGIEFPGWDATRSNLIAEVEMTEEPELGVRHDERGTHALGRREYQVRDGEIVYGDGGPIRVMVTEAQVGSATEPTLRELRDAVISVYGTDFGMHNPTWISRFTDTTRQAAAYRAGRVLLAGDAAHVHYPVGGQGLSLGVQDAVNLGWKLRRWSVEPPRNASLTPITPSVTRLSPVCSGTRSRWGRSSAMTIACRLCSSRYRSWPAWMSLASGSPVFTPGSTFTTTSVRDIRCSAAACPISTWSPRVARSEQSACSTTPAPCSSTWLSPATWTSLHGRIGSGWSTLNTPVCGNFP